ncbi:hypothetical protein NIA73_01215, partial [Anaerobutyricum hallii]|nr:hypothetical protein [Anaerobutyricum hallii]
GQKSLSVIQTIQTQTRKTVSDDDEKNVLSNTLTNADETFTYTVSKEIRRTCLLPQSIPSL